MDAFIKQLTAAQLLIFSLAMGLVFSVIANYLTRFLDKSVSTGTSRLRGMFKQAREKRVARQRQLTEWIDSRQNGILLAQNEGNFFTFIGLTLVAIDLIGAGIVITLQGSESRFRDQLPMVVVVFFFAILGMSFLATGSRIRTAVLRHASGLAGLYPDNS
jgi:hypothetical protein